MLELGWWMTQITQRPLAARSLRWATTCIAAIMSSPLVGSSKNMIDGLEISSSPIERRFFSPPDMFATGLWAHLERPSSFRTSTTIADFWAIVVVGRHCAQHLFSQFTDGTIFPAFGLISRARCGVNGSRECLHRNVADFGCEGCLPGSVRSV
uniref:Uncharacterized protein n=1 Tax=Anopheles coluzzii TaxID=1518534 RepID=A0A8W7PIF3_ANOCL